MTDTTNQPITARTPSKRKRKKNNRPKIGGTAVAGARSTQPKQTTTTNNPQQQEVESYNRSMRRRMQQMGTGPYGSQPKTAKTLQQRRKEKIERLKQRRAAHVAAIKRSLPGGKLSTDTKRVYYLIAGVALAIVAIIVLFIILRLTHILH